MSSSLSLRGIFLTTFLSKRCTLAKTLIAIMLPGISGFSTTTYAGAFESESAAFCRHGSQAKDLYSIESCDLTTDLEGPVEGVSLSIVKDYCYIVRLTATVYKYLKEYLFFFFFPKKPSQVTPKAHCLV